MRELGGININSAKHAQAAALTNSPVPNIKYDGQKQCTI